MFLIVDLKLQLNFYLCCYVINNEKKMSEINLLENIQICLQKGEPKSVLFMPKRENLYERTESLCIFKIGKCN